ncbi:MAG: sulfite exporter TauE/SafE family protein, partial [Desulfobacteraceae bacterium]|nr:sulfite exporter TauE/SafE family protein [Desulfobacteraceae bacterium]
GAGVVAFSLPACYLKLYFGLVVTAMRILILIKHRAERNFSWKNIIRIGAVISFNKGMSGGGYGPLIVSGQILSGVNVKNSIGITALAEGVTCFIGVAAYFTLGTHVDWVLAPYLIVGSLISVPLSVHTVKKMKTEEFTLIIGAATTLLGLFTLAKLIILII